MNSLYQIIVYLHQDQNYGASVVFCLALLIGSIGIAASNIIKAFHKPVDRPRRGRPTQTTYRPDGTLWYVEEKGFRDYTVDDDLNPATTSPE